jgi:hypothetical protein
MEIAKIRLLLIPNLEIHGKKKKKLGGEPSELGTIGGME